MRRDDHRTGFSLAIGRACALALPLGQGAGDVLGRPAFGLRFGWGFLGSLVPLRRDDHRAGFSLAIGRACGLALPLGQGAGDVVGLSCICRRAPGCGALARRDDDRGRAVPFGIPLFTVLPLRLFFRAAGGGGLVGLVAALLRGRFRLGFGILARRIAFVVIRLARLLCLVRLVRLVCLARLVPARLQLPVGARGAPGFCGRQGGGRLWRGITARFGRCLALRLGLAVLRFGFARPLGLLLVGPCFRTAILGIGGRAGLGLSGLLLGLFPCLLPRIGLGLALALALLRGNHDHGIAAGLGKDQPCGAIARLGGGLRRDRLRQADRGQDKAEGDGKGGRVAKDAAHGGS